MKRYEAPWSKLLIGISSALTVLCLGIGVVTTQNGSGAVVWLGWLPVTLAAACALFTIRGYAIAPDAILVRRLLWATELPRVGLESAQSLPHAMRGSIRTLGNGGIFSFSGFYWNKALRTYRAFVTDPGKTVVLRYRSRHPVVPSPSVPDDFVRDLGCQTLRRSPHSYSLS